MEDYMNETIQKIITERANSFEYGKSNHRIKIYYDTPNELKEHIDKLKELGLMPKLNKEEEYGKDKY